MIRRLPRLVGTVGGALRTILSGAALASLGSVALAGAQDAATQTPLIAVDVGHSLARPGATSARGTSEFVFNRALAEVVEQQLRDRGSRTRLIGADGDIDTLTDRSAAAAAAGAALLVSIHHDSVQPRYLSTWRVNGQKRRFSDRFSGYSLFVSRRNPQTQASLACARAVGTALRNAGFTPSLHHAEPIRGEGRPLADASLGVYYFDDLVVLRTATMPAVLLEAGIILNRADETRLRDPRTQQRLALAVGEGVTECLEDKEVSR
jgi:N-acetylmuramoyl-L-alanine amidase